MSPASSPSRLSSRWSPSPSGCSGCWPPASSLRVLSGPRFSPFGLLATKVVAPRLGPPRLVPGPPKRFAQGLGLAFSLLAAIAVTLGATTLGWVLVVLLIGAAVLESVFAFCLGCAIFGLLQRAGMVPESVCEACVVGSR